MLSSLDFLQTILDIIVFTSKWTAVPGAGIFRVFQLEKLVVDDNGRRDEDDDPRPQDDGPRPEDDGPRPQVFEQQLESSLWGVQAIFYYVQGASLLNFQSYLGFT